MTELLELLEKNVSDATRKSKEWPKDAPRLGKILRRLVPSLKRTGWSVEIDEDARPRTVRIRRENTVGTDPTDGPARKPEKTDDSRPPGADGGGGVTVGSTAPVSNTDGGGNSTDMQKGPVIRASDSTVSTDSRIEAYSTLGAAAGVYTSATTLEELDRVIEGARAAGLYTFDVETDSKDDMVAVPLGFSLAYEEGKAFYVPLRAAGVTCIPEEAVKERLGRLLLDPKLRYVGHNAKYDLKVLTRWGLRPVAIHCDTMVAAWVVDSTRYAYGLDRLAKDYLNYDAVPYAEVVPKGATIADIPLERATAYSGEDADLTLRLYHLLSAELDREGLSSLAFEVESPLVEVLADMELAGIRLLPEELEKRRQRIEGELSELEQEIFRLCGKQFNLRSSAQLQEVLFKERKLKSVKSTLKGNLSTDTAVLEVLAKQDPVAAKLLQHRKLSVLKSTFLDKLPLLVNESTGRLHTHYVQTGTETGRLSSKEPNLQNIPIRDEEGKFIRNAFVPAEGMKLISADYSQIELAVLAYLSQDPALLESFREGRDLHRQTASQIFAIPEKDVTSEQRAVAKTINFGVVYGMSAYGLSQRLKIPKSEAERFIATYFQRYPGVDRFLKKTIRDAGKNGYVTTAFGRRRKINEIRSTDPATRSAAERVAVNSPIQGTAADLIKLAMLALNRRLKKENLTTRILLQVHDELILEAPEQEVARSVEIVTEVMESVTDCGIPLRVNCESGDKWGDLH
jgi:DNA polymerase-1